MSVTYGFYNAVQQNGVWDREYTAEQFSAIFDGLINDGVYENVGERFQVVPSSGLTVTVRSGRAWFEHTWTLNDAPINVTLGARDASLSRIDAIIIKIDDSNRINEITVKQGVLASEPVKPTLDAHTYPLAYIRLYPETVTHPDILVDDIENAVGTDACPFVTGIIQVMSIEQLVAQWQAQWNTWLAENQSTFNTTIDDLENDVQTRIDYLDTEIYEIEQQVGADLKPIVGYDISVPVNSWSTFTPVEGTEEYKIKDKGYEYRALIPLQNVISGMRPYITWSLSDLEDAGADILNQYQCTTDGVYAYSTGAPVEAITALTVECRKTVL